MCQLNQQMQNGYNVLVMFSWRKDPITMYSQTEFYRLPLRKADTSSLHQFSLSLRKALPWILCKVNLLNKETFYGPLSVQCFVLLTIIRFKFLFNLYKSSFRQMNAKFLSVCQYRQIHWQLLTWLSYGSTDMNWQTDNWQILLVCQYRQIHWQLLTWLS